MGASDIKILYDKINQIDQTLQNLNTRLTDTENYIQLLSTRLLAIQNELKQFTIQNRIEVDNTIDTLKNNIDQTLKKWFEDLHTSVRAELICCTQSLKAEMTGDRMEL